MGKAAEYGREHLQAREQLSHVLRFGRLRDLVLIARAQYQRHSARVGRHGRFHLIQAGRALNIVGQIQLVVVQSVSVVVVIAIDFSRRKVGNNSTVRGKWAPAKTKII